MNYNNTDKVAIADIKGGYLASNLKGTVIFQDTKDGVKVHVDIIGLPEYKPSEGNSPQIGPHGFHIHNGGDCEMGDINNPFSGAGEHYNPTNQPHGNHAGDFPVLISNHGKANMTFITDKFKVDDIINKTVIIHQSPDDYRTQPAGNSGKRIACGVIKWID